MKNLVGITSNFWNPPLQRVLPLLLGGAEVPAIPRDLTPAQAKKRAAGKRAKAARKIAHRSRQV